MNKTMTAWLATAAVAVAASAQGQGMFQNLDFEGAQIIGVSGYDIATTNGLPGWAAYSGSDQLFAIPYNVAAFSPEVGLYGSNSFVISGNFGLLLSDGGSISQTSLVPTGSRSLVFKGWWSSLSPVGVFLEGQGLPFTVISSAQNYTVYRADISGFAGLTANLTFLSPVGTGLYLIDDIQFVVPEPSLLLLLSLGGLVLAGARARMRATQ